MFKFEHLNPRAREQNCSPAPDLRGLDICPHLIRDRQSGGDIVTTSEPASITGTDGKTYTPRPQPLLSRFGDKNECIALYTGGQRLLIGRLLPPSLIHS